MHSHDKAENFRRLTDAASGRWRDIINALSSIDMSDALAAHDANRSRHVTCPRRHGGKTKRQFRLFPDFDASGGGVCNSCGNFPSGFKLLEWLNGWDFRTSVKEVANYLEGRGINQPKRNVPTMRVPEFSVSKRKLKKLEEVWAGSQDLRETIGETYLRNRGITCDLPSSSVVRFHPSLSYWEEGRCLGKFPGFVSLVKAPNTGIPITIHRTFLSDDGNKADVPDAKKLMSAAVDGAISNLGGSIPLFPPTGDVLGVCEGQETGLCIRSALPDHPIWPCISATIMTKFRPPRGIRKVVIWADLDPGGAGQTAAAKLAVQLEELGIEVIIRIPGDGQVFVNMDDNHWATRNIPIERLIDRLVKSGYRVSNRRSISLDWADVWNTSPRVLLEAA